MPKKSQISENGRAEHPGTDCPFRLALEARSNRKQTSQRRCSVNFYSVSTLDRHYDHYRLLIDVHDADRQLTMTITMMCTCTTWRYSLSTSQQGYRDLNVAGNTEMGDVEFWHLARMV
jgi:hypothetical protein